MTLGARPETAPAAGADAAGLAELRRAPLETLLADAWAAARRAHPARLVVSAPGNKGYRAGPFCNSRSCFPAVSVTGPACALGCDHCGARLLESMIPAGDPRRFPSMVEELAGRGARGLLVTGGCTPGGDVPLEPFLEGLRRASDLGLRVLVHTGLVGRRLARGLREAGVDQVLLDLIGDAETVRSVYHLDRRPADYRATLEVLLEEGLTVVPHVVVGLHHGEIRGEYEALGWVAALRPAGLVLVVISPLPGTAMADVPPPPAAEAGRLAAAARLLAPGLPVSLGCARPAGPARIEIERLAVDAGVTAVAYPAEETLRHAESRGLELVFRQECCSLPAGGAPASGQTPVPGAPAQW